MYTLWQATSTTPTAASLFGMPESAIVRRDEAKQGQLSIGWHR